MSELKRTQLYEIHVAAGASMVDFGGWEMPVQYPTGIVAEHLYTRHFCSLFDVSHMGRLLIQGPERLAFLQHVLSSNVAGLGLNKAPYCLCLLYTTDAAGERSSVELPGSPVTQNMINIGRWLRQQQKKTRAETDTYNYSTRTKNR